MANTKSLASGEAAARLPPSAISAGATASLVGFGGSVALILEAARSVGASPAETVSWVAAASLGMAAITLFLSLRTRMPIIAAWSTPGAALIASSAAGLGMSAAVGGFLLAAVLLLATAAFKPLGRLIERIPASVASAMLAGILIRFCLELVGAAEAAPLLVLGLVAMFFVMQVWKPGLAVLTVIPIGIAAAGLGGLIEPDCCRLTLTRLTVIVPSIEPAVVIGLGVPLYLVTMASQNLPGLAVLKADGYRPSAGAAMAPAGVASLLLAPFGSHSLCLSSITAAICTGPTCHPDPARRWVVGPVYAAGCLLLAVFAESFIGLLLALPAALITTFAGLALFGPARGALKAALNGPPDELDAAAVTFIVAASGVSIAGVGSALWALVAGLFVLALGRMRVVSSGYTK